MKATKKDIAHLEALYAGRKPYRGELHDHSDSGGTSDGKCTLPQWKVGMQALDMDFATIADHKQVLHMYHPDWDNRIFIGGTEPGTTISDSKAQRGRMHYNMIFARPQPLEELLAEFEEYQFTGGPEGHFGYPKFTTERFGKLIDRVREKGGFFVHPHPKQLMESEDPLDYWFRDETGLEVIYAYHEPADNEMTAANYKLWTALLALGKRVWATAGSDEHHAPTSKALTTIYAEEQNSQCYVDHLRTGDFTAGPVGIRMCVGDTAMGGQCDFTGKRLTFSISDFHRCIYDPSHTYQAVLIAGDEVIFSKEISLKERNYFAFDTQNYPFYRVEVFDSAHDLPIAIGNPIWNRI